MRKSRQSEQVHSRGICPIGFKQARKFIQDHHRYLAAPRGCLFCVAAFDGPKIVAVAIVGRPVSRSQDDGVTAEISRLCTHEAPQNTVTALISRIVTATRSIGYHRVITYIDGELDGAGFKAGNFVVTAEQPRVAWHSRPFCVPSNASATAKRYELRQPSYLRAVTASKLRRSLEGPDVDDRESPSAVASLFG